MTGERAMIHVCPVEISLVIGALLSWRMGREWWRHRRAMRVLRSLRRQTVSRETIVKYDTPEDP